MYSKYADWMQPKSSKFDRNEYCHITSSIITVSLRIKGSNRLGDDAWSTRNQIAVPMRNNRFNAKKTNRNGCDVDDNNDIFL